MRANYFLVVNIYMQGIVKFSGENDLLVFYKCIDDNSIIVTSEDI